jgi:hypothetical protein
VSPLYNEDPADLPQPGSKFCFWPRRVSEVVSEGRLNGGLQVGAEARLAIALASITRFSLKDRSWLMHASKLALL